MQLNNDITEELPIKNFCNKIFDFGISLNFSYFDLIEKYDLISDDKFRTICKYIKSIDIENVKYLKGNAMDLQWIQSQLKLRDYDAIVDFMVYQTTDFDALRLRATSASQLNTAHNYH